MGDYYYPWQACDYTDEPNTLQQLPQFHGMESENPYLHVRDFEEDVVVSLEDNQGVKTCWAQNFYQPPPTRSMEDTLQMFLQGQYLAPPPSYPPLHQQGHQWSNPYNPNSPPFYPQPEPYYEQPTDQLPPRQTIEDTP